MGDLPGPNSAELNANRHIVVETILAAPALVVGVVGYAALKAFACGAELVNRFRPPQE